MVAPSAIDTYTPTASQGTSGVLPTAGLSTGVVSSAFPNSNPNITLAIVAFSDSASVHAFRLVNKDTTLLNLLNTEDGESLASAATGVQAYGDGTSVTTRTITWASGGTSVTVSGESASDVGKRITCAAAGFPSGGTIITAVNTTTHTYTLQNAVTGSQASAQATTISTIAPDIFVPNPLTSSGMVLIWFVNLELPTSPNVPSSLVQVSFNIQTNTRARFMLKTLKNDAGRRFPPRASRKMLSKINNGFSPITTALVPFDMTTGTTGPGYDDRSWVGIAVVNQGGSTNNAVTIDTNGDNDFSTGEPTDLMSANAIGTSVFFWYGDRYSRPSNTINITRDGTTWGTSPVGAVLFIAGERAFMPIPSSTVPVETDSTFSLGRQKIAHPGFPTENDSSFQVAQRGHLTFPTEQDLAPVTGGFGVVKPAHRVAIPASIPTEVDTAFLLKHSVPVTFPTETDTVFSMGGWKITQPTKFFIGTLPPGSYIQKIAIWARKKFTIDVGDMQLQLVDGNTNLPSWTSAWTAMTDTLTEYDFTTPPMPLDMSNLQIWVKWRSSINNTLTPVYTDIEAPATIGIQMALEHDTAFQIVMPNVLRFPTEHDSAFPVGHYRITHPGFPTEFDTGFVIVPIQVRLAGMATELDTAFLLRGVKKRSFGIAAEADLAFSISQAGQNRTPISRANEFDTCFQAFKAATVTDTFFEVALAEFNSNLELFTEGNEVQLVDGAKVRGG